MVVVVEVPQELSEVAAVVRCLLVVLIQLALDFLFLLRPETVITKVVVLTKQTALSMLLIYTEGVEGTHQQPHHGEMVLALYGAVGEAQDIQEVLEGLQLMAVPVVHRQRPALLARNPAVGAVLGQPRRGPVLMAWLG